MRGDRLAQAHLPWRTVGASAHDGHVAAQVHDGVFDAVVRKHVEHAIGDVSLRDAAELEACIGVGELHS